MRQNGNALIVVLAILMILSAAAVSFERMTTQELRAAKNHLKTLDNIALLEAAEEIFRDTNADGDGDDDYATLADLCLATLLGGSFCDDHRTGGYDFEIEVVGMVHYRVAADPAFPGVTGNDRFTRDPNGVILQALDPNAAVGRARLISALEDDFVETWKDLVAHGLGSALGFAQASALDPNAHAVIVGALDASDDGFLDEAELLGSDLLELAQTAAPSLPLPHPSPGDVVSDAELVEILDAHRARLEAALKLGLSDEGPLPPVPVGELAPNPFAFFGLLAVAVPLLSNPWLLLGTAVLGLLGGWRLHARRA